MGRDQISHLFVYRNIKLFLYKVLSTDLLYFPKNIVTISPLLEYISLSLMEDDLPLVIKHTHSENICHQ